MNKTEVMKTLKAAGSESARKTYARYGITCVQRMLHTIRGKNRSQAPHR